ncbi:hypothetical protein CRM22_011226 [Opisthorchis felineus]|uniref:Uncharacterized protein n=1 Tax=Opisthorchis felineus TaxID=147828 RepID=A0A4S2K4P4_OPIFE|nr:hypothetical protein CRM22_011226 [Opisthorchis felineus]
MPANAVNGHPHRHFFRSTVTGDFGLKSTTDQDGSDYVKPTPVRHIVVHVEVPESVVWRSRISNKKISKVGPTRLCRMLKNKLGPNIGCTGTKWETGLSEEDSSATVDPKWLRSLILNELPSIEESFNSLPVPTTESLTEMIFRFQVTLVKNELPHTWTKIFPQTSTPLYERPVENLCALVTKSIEENWTSSCTENIICSGRLLTQSPEAADFSVRLYIPNRIAVEICPDTRTNSTRDTLVHLLNDWLTEETFGLTKNNIIEFTAALLRMELKVPHSSMAYLQQSQSEGYHFAENEVTHQLEQIILIRKMDEKMKHFEFRDFAVGTNGSVFALFNIVLQPPEATFEHVNRELQETLSLIRSTRITAQKKIKYYMASSSRNVCIINLAVERQNMDKVAYSKMLDKRSGPYRWLDYQIHLFVVSSLQRCDFYDCIEKFETQITPVYHHLETTHLKATLEVTINHTMLVLQRKSNVTAFLVCINAGQYSTQDTEGERSTIGQWHTKSANRRRRLNETWQNEVAETKPMLPRTPIVDILDQRRSKQQVSGRREPTIQVRFRRLLCWQCSPATKLWMLMSPLLLFSTLFVVFLILWIMSSRTTGLDHLGTFYPLLSVCVADLTQNNVVFER